jgi:hypothetical protein
VTVTGTTTGDLAGRWPLFGLLIETPRLQLRLPPEDELPSPAEAARDIAGPDEPGMRRAPAAGPATTASLNMHRTR